MQWNWPWRRQIILGEVFGEAVKPISAILDDGKLSAPYPQYRLWPIKSQNFKLLKTIFWLQIQIPLKKLIIESVFLFSKFHRQHCQKLRSSVQNKALNSERWNFPFQRPLKSYFEGVPIRILKKEKHFWLSVFWEEFKSTVKFRFGTSWNFDFL